MEYSDFSDELVQKLMDMIDQVDKYLGDVQPDLKVPAIDPKNKNLMQNLVNKIINRGDAKVKDLQFFFKKYKEPEKVNGNQTN